jgi:hypothetical protein
LGASPRSGQSARATHYEQRAYKIKISLNLPDRP